ncbi:MAG: hypothetical protein PHS17_03260 [Desulfobacterales bacterium]|nr:hypothetical protein [Desulfobacterales bacterium]
MGLTRTLKFKVDDEAARFLDATDDEKMEYLLKRMSEDFLAMIRSQIDVHVARMVYRKSNTEMTSIVQREIETSNIYQIISKKVEDLVNGQFDEKLSAYVARLVRRRFPPSIVYVQEEKNVPAPLVPLCVKETYAPPVCPCIYFL